MPLAAARRGLLGGPGACLGGAPTGGPSVRLRRETGRGDLRAGAQFNTQAPGINLGFEASSEFLLEPGVNSAFFSPDYHCQGPRELRGAGRAIWVG